MTQHKRRRDDDDAQDEEPEARVHSESGILAFLQCRTCSEQHCASRFYVGMTDQFTARVWCALCDKLVGDLHLRTPIPLHCQECGAPIAEGHKH